MSSRGASEVTGIVLLFGMAFAGAALVAVAGGFLIDSLQTEAELQQVELTAEAITDRLQTVATDRDATRALPTDMAGQYDVTDEGTVQLAWHNESTPTNAGIDWSGPTNASEPVDLGTIELLHGDTAVVHQGGGVWRDSGDGVAMLSPPSVGFDEERVELDIMQIDGEEFDRTDPVAAYNSSATASALDDLTQTPHRDRPNLAIRIESEFHEGWRQAFEATFDPEEHDDITIESGSGYVLVSVEDVHDGLEAGPIIIEEDRGINRTAENVVSPNNQGQTDADVPSKIEPDVLFENVGTQPEAAEVNFTVLGHAGALSDTALTPTIDPDGSVDASTGSLNSWKLSKSDLQSELDPGNTYQYTLTVVNDSNSDEVYDELEQPGQFFYLYETVHYDVADTAVDTGTDEIDLSATIQNLGAVDGDNDPENVTIDISHAQVDEGTVMQTEASIDSAEAAEVSWTVEESEWLNGEYEFTIRTESDLDGESGTFEVTDGIEAVVVAEDNGVQSDQQIPGTDGQVVDEDEEVTINATILNTDDEAKTNHEVTAEVLGESAEDSTQIDIDSFEAKEISFDIDVSTFQEGDIYDYNVTTEDDGLDTPGSFLLREPVPELEVQDVTVLNEPVKPFEELEVEAEFENNKPVDGDQFVWLEGFDGGLVGLDKLHVDSQESDITTTLEWGNVSVVDEQGTVTVQTPFDEQNATVDIEPRLEIDAVSPTEAAIDPGDTATVEATLDALGGEADQTVTLSDQDETELNSTTFQGADGTVELQTDTMDRTEYVTVETEDESMQTAVVVEREKPECGINYDGSGTSNDPYQVGTIDGLQCIDEHDLGAHYELVDDIPAHGTEHWNSGAGFKPIAEQFDDGDEFEGKFDGQGHMIEGLHIDRPDEDFVGLFATTWPFHDGDEVDVGEGATVQNLRVEDGSVHGQQVTGGVIGGAGGPVENVRVSGTVEAEHQEVGGIVGHSHNADLDNRLVSVASVRGGVPAAATAGVSHPWGADNMGIGGIVGGTGFNTEVSTAYSRADMEGPGVVGGIVGWTSDFASHNDQMYWADGDITITKDQDEVDDWQSDMGRDDYDQDNTGGAIFGRGDDDDDSFADSVYMDVKFHSHAFGEHVRAGDISIAERTTAEMQGLNVTEDGRMGNLDFEEDGGPWVAIPGDYPRFAWELEAEGFFDVAITDADDDVRAGEVVEVEVDVTSFFEDSEEENVTQQIRLEDPDGNTVDSEPIELPSTLGDEREETITLQWNTRAGDDGVNKISVRSEDTQDTETVDIAPADTGPGDSPPGELGPGGQAPDDFDGLDPGESDTRLDFVLDVAIDVDSIKIW